MTAPQNTEQKPEQANKDKFKHALAYVPFLAVLLFFVEQNKTPEMKKHISYGMILLFGYLICSAILGILGIPLGPLVGIAYVVVSAYLGFMAFNGKDVTIKQLDEIDKQIQNNMK